VYSNVTTKKKLSVRKAVDKTTARLLVLASYLIHTAHGYVNDELVLVLEQDLWAMLRRQVRPVHLLNTLAHLRILHMLIHRLWLRQTTYY
jgi:hypothetical protein